MNQGYANAVVDSANLVIKDAEYHGSNPLKSRIEKLFIKRARVELVALRGTRTLEWYL